MQATESGQTTESPARTSPTTIRLGAIEVSFLVESDDSEGAATVFETSVAPGAKVPEAHSHDGFEETVYGLAGVLTFTVDGQSREIAPGDAVCIRRGQVHHFANFGSTEARFLSVATPGVFGPAFFQEIRDVFISAAGGPPDVSALGAVMRRHGLTPA